MHVAERLVEAPFGVVGASSAAVAAAHGLGSLRIAGGRGGGEQPTRSCSSPDLADRLPIRPWQAERSAGQCSGPTLAAMRGDGISGRPEEGRRAEEGPPAGAAARGGRRGRRR